MKNPTRIEEYLDKATGGTVDEPMPDAITRIEKWLAKIAGEDVETPEITEGSPRIEKFLAAIAGEDVELPEITEGSPRIEKFLAQAAGETVEDLPDPMTRIEEFLAELQGGEQPVLLTYSGNLPATITAVAHALASLTRYGLCTQDGTPTPDAPVDIMTNNGAIKLRRPSGMPIAYQMVEWLKPTGSIPITGFKTKSTQEIETVFYRESRGSTYLYASDSATSGTTNTTAYLTTAGGNWRWDGKVATVNVPAGSKITSIQNKDGVWLNGTRYGVYTDAGEFVSTSDLRLSSNENTTVRIYSMTIREGETVTLDLVPVQRVTDSAYGFYDKVSGNFYTNADATFDAGDPIPDPVEIYTDGTPEVLTVSGKNLFDKDNMPAPVYTAYISNASGEGRTRLVSGTSERTVLMPIEPNTTYTVTKVYTDRLRIAEFSTIPNISPATYGTLLASDTSDAQRTECTITTGATAAYLAIQINNAGLERQSTTLDAVLASLQVEEGSTATDYEPYNAQTVTVPMLLGVDAVKDEWEAVHGPLTHRIGIYVIKGSDDEGWAETATSSGTFYADCLPVAVSHPAKSLFTRYKGVDSSTAVSGMTNRTAKCGSTSNRQRIFIRDVSCADVDALKAKLAGFYAAGEPCIVAFALATETTEQTTPNHLVTNKGVNVVDSTANVEPVEVELQYYGTEAPMLSLGMGLMGMRPNSDSPEEPIEEEPIEEEPAEEIPEAEEPTEEIAEEPIDDPQEVPKEEQEMPEEEQEMPEETEEVAEE